MSAKEWQLLERFVAACEQALGPKGAIIKSPDYLRDIETGEKREVDASIRYPVGSVEILITVECRDREQVQDATWIEQLVQKKKSLGAHGTIAVSSSGFGAPAIEKARLNSIEIRQVQSIDDSAVAEWFASVRLTIEYRVFQIVSVAIAWAAGVIPDGVGNEVNLKLEDAWHSPMFCEGPIESDVSIAELLSAHWSEFDGLNLEIGDRKLTTIPLVVHVI